MFGYLFIITSFLLFAILAFNSDPSKEIEMTYIYRVAFTIWLFIPGFLIIYLLILFKPREMLKTKAQLLVLSLYFFICSIIIFVPNGIRVTIYMNGETQWPTWNLTVTVYVLFISIIMSIISTVIYNKVQQTFTIPLLKKRLNYLLFGILCLYFDYFFAAIVGYSNLPVMRIAQFFVNNFCLIAGLFVYYAVGPKIEIPIIN
jgi:hypothetical protein